MSAEQLDLLRKLELQMEGSLDQARRNRDLAKALGVLEMQFYQDGWIAALEMVQELLKERHARGEER